MPKDPVPAIKDSPVSEDTVPTPSIPQKLWTPLTISLTVFVGIIVLSIVFLSFLAGGQYKSDKLSDSNILPTSTPTPTPTPIILKPDEGVKGNYTVSQSAKETGPTFSTVTFDPLDVQKGQTLTITITLSSQSPVSAVTGTLNSDTTSTPIVLQKSSQTATTSIWSAAIPITDTLWYTYILKVDAVNGTGTSSVTVAPRS